MAGDPAELAFRHCLAVLGDPARAADAAAAALRRAGRSRGLVLAHARHQALLTWDDGEWPDETTSEVDPSEPGIVARALAATRPAAERSVVDARNRTGTDRAALGRALGATPTAAALRATEIAEGWDRDLDPAMLALLGPGDCVDLAALLADVHLRTVADLLAASPSVAAHTSDCESCADRLRAMASVRALVGRDVEPVPEEVRVAGRVSRRRRPAALPPALFGTSGAARARRALPIAVAVAAAAAIAVIAIAAGPGGDGNKRVQALTKLPATGGSFTLGPAATSGKTAAVTFDNNAPKDLAWKAELSVPWAEAQPASGTVEGSGRGRLLVKLLDSAPEGDVRAKLTVTGSDGSTAVTELTWVVEREPEIAATATGCDIKINVVEDGELSALVLHWRDQTEHEAPITEGPDGYSSMLAPSSVPLTWWITAVDARGNSARSADSVIQPGTC